MGMESRKGFELSKGLRTLSLRSDETAPSVSCANTSSDSLKSPSENSAECYTEVECANSAASSRNPSKNSNKFMVESLSSSTSINPSDTFNHETPNPWESTCIPKRVKFQPQNDVPERRIFTFEVPKSMTKGSSKKCCCKAKYSPIVVLVLILAAIFGVVFVILISNAAEEVACRFLTNEIICPFKHEYSRIHILNPLVHLVNGSGRISYELRDGTDVTLHGFNIRVRNQTISVRKQPSDCAEEGEYPVKFTNVNSTQLHENRLQLKVKDISEDMKIAITPFTNISDNKEYVQVVCTGYHRCGTVVVDLELKLSDYGTYYKPMNCLRTNADGDVLDNYGYACTLFMDEDMFQRTGSLKCKPMVESLENATTEYLFQRSVDVNNSTKSNFSLESGKRATIMWNVNVQKLKDIRQLRTNLNGVLHPNESTTDTRSQLFVRIKGYIATCEVRFHPVTCIDEGPWELQFQNGDIQHKQIQVDGKSKFTVCPSQINVTVGGQLKLQFRSCIRDGFNAYSVDLYGRTNRSGSIQENAAIEISDQRTKFHGILDLNELSVTTEMHQITCADHRKEFKMDLGPPKGNTSKQFVSLSNVVGRYESFSTGGDFRENFHAVVNLRIHLGCRPQNLEININGSFLADAYNITEDSSTGEKMFSKSFSFPKISMLDNGTSVALNSSFIDDEESPRNLSITQLIRIVPETFCQGKPYGCNYHHPYNANMMVACGEGIIAAFRNCQPGLVFFNSSCVGQCCQEGSTTNCQRP